VGNTLVHIENNTVCVTLEWRAPKDAGPEFVASIRNFLAHMRESKIQQTEGEVNEMFDLAEERYHFKVHVDGLDKDPISCPQVVTPRLVELVGNFRMYLPKLHPRQLVSAAEPGQGASPSVPIESPAELGQPLGPVTLSIAAQLEEWFWKNRVKRHVELVNKAHTDTLVHCRSLVSDQRLVRAVTDYLFAKYKASEIKTIAAVGTSAIPLAVNLAYRLNATVTFTFFDPHSKGQEKGEDRDNGKDRDKEQDPPKHYDVEVAPVIPTSLSGKLLILDDVIARGRVARDLVSQIVKLGVQSGSIVHLSLFRLGSQDIEAEKVENVPYEYICHIKDVYYADSQDECERCKAGEPFVHEWDA
jgi:orotate phosphoribosyltransferase